MIAVAKRGSAKIITPAADWIRWAQVREPTTRKKASWILRCSQMMPVSPQNTSRWPRSRRTGASRAAAHAALLRGGEAGTGRLQPRRAQLEDELGGVDDVGGVGGQGQDAIPINTVRNVAAQIISSGKAEHAYLGLDAAPVTPQLAKLFHLPSSSGLLIQDVTVGSGADKAGLREGKTTVVVQGESYQVGGDLIVAIDGTPVFPPTSSFATRSRSGSPATS